MPASSRARESSISPPPSKRRKAEAVVDQSEYETGDPDNLAVYSWNINGIGPFVQRPITSFFQSSTLDATRRQPEHALCPLREILRRNGWPTVLFLQEVRISPNDSATQRAVERAVLPTVDEGPGQPSYKVFFCLPSDKHNARGFGRKVYGVCSIIRQDFYDRYVECVREVEWDKEGRFLVCETRAIDRLPKLAIINIYAVNGTEAPYKDPETGDVVGTRHDRKLQVHKLLQAECQALEAKAVRVILAGDLNVARASIDGHPGLRTVPKQHCLNRADFNFRFLQVSAEDVAVRNGEDHDGYGTLALTDAFRHLHPRRAAYTYYPRGVSFGSSCDRVDMILLSSSLLPSLVKADILETIADRGPSDHVPLFVHMSFKVPANETDR